MVGLYWVFGRGASDHQLHSGEAVGAFEWAERGTETLSRKALNEKWEQLGATPRISVHRGIVQISLSTLSRNIDAAVDLLGEMLCAPSWSTDELEQLRDDLLARDAGAMEHAEGRASSALPFALFGTATNLDDEPDERIGWVQPIAGRRRDRRRWTRTRLSRALGRILSAPAVCGAWGDEPAQLRPALERLLQRVRGAWPEDAANSWRQAPAVIPGRQVVMSSTGDQASVLIYFRGPPVTDPLYPAFNLMVHAFGDGFQSPLVQTVRSDRGLSYDVHASASPSTTDSLATISGAPRSGEVGAFIDAVRDAWDRHVDAGWNDTRRTSVLRYIEGTDLVSHETARARLSIGLRRVLMNVAPQTLAERRDALDAVTRTQWDSLVETCPISREEWVLVAACRRGIRQTGWTERWRDGLMPLSVRQVT
jgi:predicted Zn-dependent peptidase